MKYALLGVGVMATGVAGLLIKNILEERNTKDLNVEKVIRILKLLRKEKYIMYKQIATFAVNIARQTRNNINAQMVQMFINGPQSPIKIKEEIQKATQQICTKQNITGEAFNKSLQTYQDNEEVIFLVKQQERDYQLSLTGKMPAFNVNIPSSLTTDKFLAIQNQITKKSYLQQVSVFKKLTQYSEEELAQNPQLLTDLGNHQKEQEQILEQEGLGSQFQPAFAVYQNATVKFRNDAGLRIKINKIEEGYQRILMRYTMKIQNKTITAQELNELEDQIIFFDPLV